MANGRKTGGRQKGTPNKATADIKALARVHGHAAIAELARMSGLTDAPGAQTETARLAALRELLDRGYGRATQPLDVSEGEPIGLMHLIAARSVAEALQRDLEAGRPARWLDERGLQAIDFAQPALE